MAQNFNNFNKELERVKAAALTGMDKGVTKLQEDTMALTHVLTGALRRSWTHTSGIEGDKIIGSVGSNLRYAPYEDDYHPNLSQAFEMDKQMVFDTIKAEIEQGTK